MSTERLPPRFVPTLTEVVQLADIESEALPPGWTDAVPLSPETPTENTPVTQESKHFDIQKLEQDLGERLRQTLERHMHQALKAALQEIDPLVRVEVAQAFQTLQGAASTAGAEAAPPPK